VPKKPCENTCKQYKEKHTVKLPHSGHLGDRGKWPLKDSHYGKVWVKYDTVFFFQDYNNFILSVVYCSIEIQNQNIYKTKTKQKQRPMTPGTDQVL